MTEEVVTADKIINHLQCPRRYEFEFDRPLDARSVRDSVREQWNELLRKSVIKGLQIREGTASERRNTALDYFDENKDSISGLYLVDEQGKYEQSIAREAIEAYFESDIGREHAENVQEIDIALRYERDGIQYEIDVDAVVKSNNGYQALQFVPTISLKVDWYDDNVEKFRNGEKFFPSQIGYLAEAEIAIRGLVNEHGLDPYCDYGYVSLVDHVQRDYSQSGSFDVRITTQFLGNSYEAERKDVDQLVKSRAKAIINGRSDPRQWQIEEILDGSCGDCLYQDACPEHMAHDASFTDRYSPDEEILENDLKQLKDGDDQ